MESGIEKHVSFINSLNPAEKIIIVAGATGALGLSIVSNLIKWNANVKALVRKGTSNDSVALLRNQGADIIEVDFNNEQALSTACVGGYCLVSALSGLQDVIVDVQTRLLNAAIKAGVPRFIPSDYCIDYTKLAEGSNRNLDFRRKFAAIVDKAPIQSTSVLNGMFTDLLTGAAPVVMFPIKRILYWGNAEQAMDFTTMADTALVTATVALDHSTPRYLRFAGDVQNARGLMAAATKVTGSEFKLFRLGGLGAFANMIKVTRFLLPKKDEVFPPWQGMQYLHNMFTGIPKFQLTDNSRYPHIQWTLVEDVLAERSKA